MEAKCHLCRTRIKRSVADVANCDYLENNFACRCDKRFASPPCQWEGHPRDIERHRTRECLHAETTCEWCDETFTRFKYAQHWPGCAFRPVNCDLCQNVIPLVATNTHQLLTCAKKFYNDPDYPGKKISAHELKDRTSFACISFQGLIMIRAQESMEPPVHAPMCFPERKTINTSEWKRTPYGES